MVLKCVQIYSYTCTTCWMEMLNVHCIIALQLCEEQRQLIMLIRLGPMSIVAICFDYMELPSHMHCYPNPFTPTSSYNTHYRI